MQIPFLKYKRIYYIFSGLLTIGSVIVVLTFGLKFGIDFTGGSVLEVVFEQRPENPVILEKLKDLNLGDITIQPTGEKGVIIKLKEIDETTHQQILSRLNEISKTEEGNFESIGPMIGKELRQKTIILIIVSLVALLIYIAISFRRVSRPLSSWQYGIISIVALSFDVLVPIGGFAILGKLYNVQFNIPIITALLTILGYTINDKVIVFDRIRENLLRGRAGDFEYLVDQSLNQTLFRSLSTGSCTLFVLLTIFFFGGETLKYFAFTLIIGITVGTYSSLFLAAPLLVSWLGLRAKK
ncbi:MAG: protein translocase subunit SecF [Candidatus Staskawiczbacteria bacterium CG10_big_fil_rev_8_21_14_0_10_38_10]|uniref:Protein-export membrane protein SecF n=1 Tax=Candidatus Staskawiczbacteria bacterium CG10_big_fil_rev_8_21_14_0_10_38_10 TaxID=1974891 RepID=A0A2H9T164_9BACT|nr:MAG: protein translocase subunit SecF [Candidatus Staskawiczbacteria bacterium CG10_big_fil_rev_8_21_14_0_10_38_10]